MNFLYFCCVLLTLMLTSRDLHCRCTKKWLARAGSWWRSPPTRPVLGGWRTRLQATSGWCCTRRRLGPGRWPCAEPPAPSRSGRRDTGSTPTYRATPSSTRTSPTSKRTRRGASEAKERSLSSTPDHIGEWPLGGD